METRILPNTDLAVSRACLGTMMFGSQTNEQMAARIVDRCIDHGINFFDTANVYNFGRAETIVGNLLKGRRNSVVLATKVGMKMGDGPLEAGLSTGAILKNIDDSLRRLQTDYLDICYLHSPDYAVPIEEALEALDKLVRSGKVRYTAFSNYAAWQACQILWVCEKHGYQAPMISQPVYNLLARGIEQEYIPFCKQFGVSMVVYNPLARGLLAGTQQRKEPVAAPPGYNHQWALDRYQHPAYFVAVDELIGIARCAERSLTDLAINWLLHHTPTDCMILGVLNVGQLEQNITILDHGPLSGKTVIDCDAVWQTLCGIMPKYCR
jgi:aryl-alcohol dehydrogenase-like predicted oxidoreductase